MTNVEKEKLIKEVEPVIVWLAGNFSGRYYPSFDDFYSEGLCAVYKYIDRYDSKKSKIETFVSKYIRGAMIDFMEFDKSIKIRGTNRYRTKKVKPILKCFSITEMKLSAGTDEKENHINRIRSFIEKLPIHLKHIIYEIMNEKSMAEIARSLNTSVWHISHLKKEAYSLLQERITL